MSSWHIYRGFLVGDRSEVWTPSPLPARGIRASSLVDMACGWDHCTAILTREGMAATSMDIRTGDGSAVRWPHYLYEYDNDGRIHIDHIILCIDMVATRNYYVRHQWMMMVMHIQRSMIMDDGTVWIHQAWCCPIW